MASIHPPADYPELLYVSAEEKAALIKARKEKLEEKVRVERNKSAVKDKTRLEEGLRELQSAVQTLKDEFLELNTRGANPLAMEAARDLINLAPAMEIGLVTFLRMASEGQRSKRGVEKGSVTLMSACLGRTGISLHIRKALVNIIKDIESLKSGLVTPPNNTIAKVWDGHRIFQRLLLQEKENAPGLNGNQDGSDTLEVLHTGDGEENEAGVKKRQRLG